MKTVAVPALTPQSERWCPDLPELSRMDEKLSVTSAGSRARKCSLGKRVEGRIQGGLSVTYSFSLPRSLGTKPLGHSLRNRHNLGCLYPGPSSHGEFSPETGEVLWAT